MPPENTPFHPADLEAATRDVRRAYVQARQALFPGYKLQNRRWETCFSKAAVWCLQYRVTPEHLVSRAFELYRPPFPNHLLSEVARRAAADPSGEFSKRKTHYEILLLKLEMDEVATELNAGRCLSDILVDSRVNIGNLLRYSLAVRGNFSEIAQRLRDSAQRELLFRTTYYVTAVMKGLPDGAVLRSHP